MSIANESFRRRFTSSQLVTMENKVAELVASWEEAEQVDACQALQDHPDLAASKTAVVGLAYGEYRLRIGRGESVETSGFVARFPRCRTTLNKLIAVDQFISENPFDTTSPEDWPVVGDDFLGYHLVEELGRGAIGRVFLAREDGMSDRWVVIKIAPSGTREGKTLSEFYHQNIVTVLCEDVDFEYGLTGTCMRFMGRSTLQDLLDASYPSEGAVAPATIADPLRTMSRPFEAELEFIPAKSDAAVERASYIDGVLRMGRQLADALDHAHGKNIWHLDLKPSNVLVTPYGVPMLLDFNLSSGPLNASHMGGTLPYMSPEQLRGIVLQREDAKREIDGRSDIYSLGVILYELLTGQHPVSDIHWKLAGKSVVGQILEGQRAGPVPVHELNPCVDRKTSSLIASCLELDVDRRMSDGAQLRDALEQRLEFFPRCVRWWLARPCATATFLVMAVALMAGMISHTLWKTPAHVRFWQDGVAAFERGDLPAAERAFTASIDHNRDNFPAYFGRAQTRVKLKAYSDAAMDYRKCNELRQLPVLFELSELAAYRSGDLRATIFRCVLYQQKTGYESLSFMNNLAYWFKLDSKSEKAHEILTRAVEIDGDNGVARYNRASTALYIGQRAERHSSKQEIADIEIALGHHKTAAAHLVAAELYIRASGGAAGNVSIALDHWEEAIRLGVKKESLLAHKTNPLLSKDRRFQKLLNHGVTEVHQGVKQPVLIWPCADSPVFNDALRKGPRYQGR